MIQPTSPSHRSFCESRFPSLFRQSCPSGIEFDIPLIPPCRLHKNTSYLKFGTQSSLIPRINVVKLRVNANQGQNMTSRRAALFGSATVSLLMKAESFQCPGTCTPKIAPRHALERKMLLCFLHWDSSATFTRGSPLFCFAPEHGRRHLQSLTRFWTPLEQGRIRQRA